jgi:hypothetical protein
MPRHPPCALHSLSHTPPTPPPHHPTTTRQVGTRLVMHTYNTPQKNTHTHPTITKQACKNNNHTHHHRQTRRRHTGAKDARVHYPDLKQQPHTPGSGPTRGPTRSRAVFSAELTLEPMVLKPRLASDSSEPQQCVVDVPQLNSTTHRLIPAQHSCWTSTRPGCTCSLERR